MSNYVVSARKYRPHRFDEVVGQNHVSKTLKNALRTNHLGHSFLFCGPRGVGKTTTARILAKVLNCENRTEDFEPCNECSSCQAFNENHSFNIFELDAASNNGVEHIRDLVEQVRFPPQQGEYKVYIIDEVHMLSQAAFNAFLKTLEEPPSYAIFILATTEKHKILPTILSRCQIFDFNRVQIDDMVDHLQYICKQEEIDAEDAALHTIAQKADGALRDALSIFDRIVSFAGDSVTYETVIESLNILDYDTFFTLTDAFLYQDKNKVLTLFDEVLAKGFDGDRVMLGLAEHIRNLLVAKDKQIVHLLEVAPTVKEQYYNQAKRTQLSFLLNALNIANACDIRYKQARNKRLHVELALLKICYLGSISKNEALPADKEEEQIKKKSSTEQLNKSDKELKDEVLPKEKTQKEPADTKKQDKIEQPGLAKETFERSEQLKEENKAQVIRMRQKPPADKGNAKELEHIEEKVQKKKKDLKSKNQFHLSSLDSAINKKKKEVDDARKQQVADDAEDFSTEGLTDVESRSVENAWSKLESIFAERGMPTLETAIQNSSITYKNFILDVSVVGEIARQLVIDNYSSIVDHIKRETGLQRFRLNIHVKEIDVNAPQTYTKQEQLEYIKKKNPAVKRLCDEFGLEIDYN